MARNGFWLAALLFVGVALPAMAATLAATPERVTLGGIARPDSDGTPAFTPGGNTVFFDRSAGNRKSIMVAHKVDGHWSHPRVARFSGHWYDQDPVVSPDGTYIVFSSDRPIGSDGKPLTRAVAGKRYHGGNLWKVEHSGNQWGTPVWLGPVVDRSEFIVAPSVAADGTLYFIQRDARDHAMHVFSSRRRDGRYLAPVRVGLGDPATTTHDPAIAPDQSFIVFGYGKMAAGLGHLCIAFREGDHWGKPIGLDHAVDALGPWGSHVSADGRALYFTGNAGAYRLSLAAWLHAHRVE